MALQNKNSLKFLAMSPLRFVFVLALPHLISTSVKMCRASFYHSLIIRYGPLWILIFPYCVSGSTIITQKKWCNITRILLKDFFFYLPLLPPYNADLFSPLPYKSPTHGYENNVWNNIRSPPRYFSIAAGSQNGSTCESGQPLLPNQLSYDISLPY